MVTVELYQNELCCLDAPHEGLRQELAALQQVQQQNYCALANLLFDQCGECNRMACLPQAAFAVHKLRKQNEKDLAVARLSTTDKQDVPRYLNSTLDLTPVKYSEKLMNSIWGLYNRYSPHNFKKNIGEVQQQQYFGMQQPFAVACAASENTNSEAGTTKYYPKK
uniref:Uncharacterized protein n=1 Tax=Psorophora albipes TaxID=869069 RepID=T1E350_9DIPT